METIDQSPDDVLRRFIERLPTSIRDVILARCCMAFGRLDRLPNQNLLGTFRSILNAPDEKGRAYLCAKMVAVVELALYECDSGSGAALARDLLELTGSHRFGNLELQAPLAQKHWRAARNEFLGLRRDALHVESLSRMITHARGYANYEDLRPAGR